MAVKLVIDNGPRRDVKPKEPVAEAKPAKKTSKKNSK